MAVTEQGKKIFGLWVLDSRTRDDTRQRVIDWMQSTNPSEYVGEFVTQDQFARWITAQTGYRILGGAISRIERSVSRNAPPIDAIAALVKAEVLLIGGRPASFDEVVDVLSGKLNPLNGFSSTQSFAN